jgi:hypothetical protein
MSETEGVFLGLLPIVELFRKFDQHLIRGILNELIGHQVLLVQVLGILDFRVVTFVVFQTKATTLNNHLDGGERFKGL